MASILQMSSTAIDCLYIQYVCLLVSMTIPGKLGQLNLPKFESYHTVQYGVMYGDRNGTGGANTRYSHVHEENFPFTLTGIGALSVVTWAVL